MIMQLYPLSVAVHQFLFSKFCLQLFPSLSESCCNHTRLIKIVNEILTDKMVCDSVALVVAEPHLPSKIQVQAAEVAGKSVINISREIIFLLFKYYHILKFRALLQ